jgi:hypothetical protein
MTAFFDAPQGFRLCATGKKQGTFLSIIFTRNGIGRRLSSFLQKFDLIGLSLQANQPKQALLQLVLF